MTSAMGNPGDSPAAIPLPSLARERWLLLLIWLPYAFLVRRFWFVSDDAYISFRFARNWAHGQGLRYNSLPGPPEEGYSNFLLVAVGALIELVGLAIEFWLPMVSFLCGTLLLVLVFRLARRRYGASLTVATLTTLTLGLAAPFTVWSSSGLETMPYALLLFLAFERLILRDRGAAAVSAGLLAVMIALIRVEGVYWTVVFIPLTALSRRMRGQPFLKPLSIYSAILAVGYGAWFLWKFQYYGHAFAATVHSKMGFSGDRLLRGAQYVGTQYLESLWLLMLIPGIVVALRPKRRAYALPVALMPIGFACLAILISGDFMTFGRFLLPSLPFTALLMAWVLQDLWELGSKARPFVVALGVGCIALALLPGFDLHLFPDSVRELAHFRRRTPRVRSEYEVWYEMRENTILWRMRGLAMREVIEPGRSVVMGAIGAAGFVSDLNVLDRHGFVTPMVAMRELTEEERADELRSPGHDHPVSPGFFLERGINPEVLYVRLAFAEDREEMYHSLKSFREACKKVLGPLVPYDLDFYEVPFENDAELKAYLLLWRRVNNWKGPKPEARKVNAELDDFMDLGRVRVLDMPPLQWGVAGVPSWFAVDVPIPDVERRRFETPDDSEG